MQMLYKIGWVVALGVCIATSGAAWAAMGSQDSVAFLLTGARTPGQGYLGVGIRDVGEEQVSALHLKDTHGAEVVLVDHDGPAGKAGLHEHDVILQMNGQPVEGAEQLHQMLRTTKPGRFVSFLVCRDGQQIKLTAKLADQSILEKQAWESHMTVPEPSQEKMPFAAGFFAPVPPVPPVQTATGFSQNNMIATTIFSPSYTGAVLETMGPQLAEFFGGAGLLVRSVDANSPAAAAGMKAGDVVVRVNAAPIANGNDWSRVMREQAGKSVSVVVLREKHEQTLTLVPDGKRRSALTLPGADPGHTLSLLLPQADFPQAN